MSTAVVIRCRDEEAHIGRLLTGIRSQSRQPDEILLVDSGSTDATLSIASGFDVRIVSINSEEFSFGRALNVGLAEIESDIVILASAHVYPLYDSWLDRMLGPFADPEIALTYGRQIAPRAALYSERRLLAKWFPSSSHAKVRTPFCNNANAAIRRKVWESQPYDEALTGLEDLAWAKSVISQGHYVSYVADAEIVHVHDETFGEIANRYRREAIAHKQIFPDQAIGMSTSAKLCLANVGDDLFHATLERELLRQAVGIFRFRIAQFYGTQRGFSQSGPVEESLLRRFYYPTGRDGHIKPQSETGTLIDYGEGHG